MENMFVSRILIVCVAAIAVVCAETTIRLEAAETSVNPGDSISFTCIAANLVGGTSFLRMSKMAVDGTETILTTNAVMASKNPRYSVKYQVGAQPSELMFIFTINNVLYGDSGTYHCMIMGSAGIIIQDKKEFTVRYTDDFMLEMTVARPGYEVVTISSFQDAIPVFELDDNENFNIKIDTTQTNPVPTMAIQVGSSSINDQFEVSETSSQFKDNNKLPAERFGLTAVGEIHVDHSYKSGFCAIATVYDQQAKACFNIKFSGFAPVVDESCTRSLLAGNHQKDVDFTCTVSSAERIEVSFKYQRLLANNKTAVEEIKLGEENHDYHYELSVIDESEPMVYTIKLHMPIVYPQMFTEYTMEVTNSIGQSTHTFKLERDQTQEPIKANEASHMIMSIATMTSLFLALFSARLL